MCDIHNYTRFLAAILVFQLIPGAGIVAILNTTVRNGVGAGLGAGFHIKFMDGRLVSVGICSHCDEIIQSPVVGTLDGLKFYALPLNEPELAEVFGASEKTRKVREVTYDH